MRDLLLCIVLMLLMILNYFLLDQNHPILYAFLITFILFGFISLLISKKYGAKIVGWGSIIQYRDYTSIFLLITQIILSLNVFVTLYTENYQFILILAGFVVMFFAMGLNFQVRKELGKNWVPLARTTEGQELVTNGIYSRVRHPFYTSILFIFLGMAIIAGNVYSLVFFILFILAILFRIKKEEKDLIKKFGEEYQEYREKVPKLFPYL